MKTRRVYVAGPITGVSDWREKHLKAVELLQQQGYEPVSVAMDEYHEADDAPKVGDDSALTWGRWMEYCLGLLRRCDAIAPLPGWCSSKDAYIEYVIARNLLGLDVVCLDELYEKENLAPLRERGYQR